MTDPVVFCTKRSGRIWAYLGIHEVGVIVPWAPEMIGRRGNGCHYQLKLSELQPAQEARTIAWARQQLLFRIADWIEGCGDMFHEQAAEIRAQAEAERVAA